ncbi:hypothetical protein D3C76_1005900 [compost metagenome]
MIDIAVLVERDHAAGSVHRQGEHRVRRGDFLSAGRGGADDHAVDVEQADRRAVAGQAAVVALGTGQRQGIAHRHIAAAIRAVLRIDLEGEGEIGAGAVMPGAQRGGVVGLQQRYPGFAERQAALRHIVDDADVQSAAGGSAVAVGDAVADLELQDVFDALHRVIQRLQQGQLEAAAFQVGEREGEYRRVAGHRCEHPTIVAQRIRQLDAAGAQLRQAGDAPAEAAGTIGAEVVVQGSADAGAAALRRQRQALYLGVATGQSARQIRLGNQRAGQSGSGLAVDWRRRRRWWWWRLGWRHDYRRFDWRLDRR